MSPDGVPPKLSEVGQRSCSPRPLMSANRRRILDTEDVIRVRAEIHARCAQGLPTYTRHCIDFIKTQLGKYRFDRVDFQRYRKVFGVQFGKASIRQRGKDAGGSTARRFSPTTRSLTATPKSLSRCIPTKPMATKMTSTRTVGHSTSIRSWRSPPVKGTVWSLLTPSRSTVASRALN